MILQVMVFLAYLYSAGTQQGYLHPAVTYFILRAYTGTKKTGSGLDKMQMNGLEG